MKTKNSHGNELTQCRLDIWLWASRFYKSRKIATEAINAGHVSINGQKGKPGKNIRVNDQLIVKKNFQRFHIEVLGLSTKRLGAPLAQALYLESEHSRETREQEAQQRKQLHAGLTYDSRRPSKRDRKSMVKLKHTDHSV